MPTPGLIKPRASRFLAHCLTWRQYAANHHESSVVEVVYPSGSSTVKGLILYRSVPVASLLDAAEGEVRLGPDRRRVHVRDARVQICHRLERTVDVARVQRAR